MQTQTLAKSPNITKPMVNPFTQKAQALAYQKIIDVFDEFDDAPWDQEFILIAKYNLLINAIHDIEINTVLSVEQKQILQEKLIELERQDQDIKQKALIERMGMPLNNNPNFNYEQWKADNGSNYRYILSQCYNSDDTIKENIKKYIIQDALKQIENMSNDGQSIDDILTEINLYLNDRASKQNIYLNEEQKQTIYHQIFSILPESIRNTCKNADELQDAFGLYKNISPYIAFNEDGKPIKVIDAFNAPSQGGVSRAQAVKMNFGYFIEDYTAIHDKETCERFVKKEVERKRLDNTEEAKEAFVRIRKAVHSEVKKEFEKAYKYPSMVNSLIKKRMQERIEKNREKANAVRLNPRVTIQRVDSLRGDKDLPKHSFVHQRFGESKGDQELLSDIQSVNEEVDRLTHSTQASTKTLKNILKEYSSLVKNFVTKSGIDDYIKNLEKRPQNRKKDVPVVQIDLSSITNSTSRSKSRLSPSFCSASTESSPNRSAKFASRNYNSSVIEQMTFGQEQSSTSIPSQMTFRPNTQEDRAKNIIAKRQQMQKEFAHKYRENAQNNNVEQGNITLVPNRTKFLRRAPFGLKLMNTPKLLQR